MFFRNVCELSDYTASYSTRQYSLRGIIPNELQGHYSDLKQFGCLFCDTVNMSGHIAPNVRMIRE
jgi:hypothetical protein